jgi:hyperosmotically inducible protein
MIRGSIRAVLLVLIVVALVAFFAGHRYGGLLLGGEGGSSTPVGTTGTLDRERARDTGAGIGEKTAKAAGAVQRAVDDGALTAKIKSKMALDDQVRALDINVDTTGGVVTLRGHVRSEAERWRALQLARETSGVTSVKDELTIRSR